jgi:hypothetical protein
MLLDPNHSEKRPLTLPEATYHVHTDVLRNDYLFRNPSGMLHPIAISGLRCHFWTHPPTPPPALEEEGELPEGFETLLLCSEGGYSRPTPMCRYASL